jgi:DNA invertase Pin-like site-specific DNA recombinase
METTTAAIYARVSTKDRQEVENQLRQLREYATARGWAVQAEYVDHESGAKSDRPQFKAMYAAAYRKAFDIVLFWDLRGRHEITFPY